MVINVDPNVVYAILIAIVMIVLITQIPRIVQSRFRNSPDESEQSTQTWPK
jgi:hypothetical protein